MFRLVVCYPGMGREDFIVDRTRNAAEKILSDACDGKIVHILTTEFDIPMMTTIDPITLDKSDDIYLYLVDFDSYHNVLEKSIFWGRKQVEEMTRFVFPSLNVNDYAEVMKYLKKKVKLHSPIYGIKSDTVLSPEYRHYKNKMNYVDAYFTHIAKLIDKIKDNDPKYYMVKTSSRKTLMHALEAICKEDNPITIIPAEYLMLLVNTIKPGSPTTSM